MSSEVVIAISGGFDPVHVGHVRMVNKAKSYGHVLVIINSNEWLMRKKGYVFMSYDERAEIMLSIKGVSYISPVDDSDDTVCEALQRLKPTYFGNGGDRTNENTPELIVCRDLGIETVFELGGEKIQSSSALASRIQFLTRQI